MTYEAVLSKLKLEGIYLPKVGWMLLPKSLTEDETQILRENGWKFAGDTLPLPLVGKHYMIPPKGWESK